jgi:hypothetical protein
METTRVTQLGRKELFDDGWTANVTWARLYTNLDVLVDEQPLTLTYDSGLDILKPTADIVFDVGAGTDDVAYVSFGYTIPAQEPAPAFDFELYFKVLPSLYDFITDGTLTIDSWDITFSGTYLLLAGRQVLIPTGFTSKITTAKLYSSTNALLDTQSVTFVTDNQTGVMSPNADIIFDVDSGIASRIKLYNTGGTELYNRTLNTTYTFTTKGTLTVDAWNITT